MPKLDKTDLRILSTLQRDGRITKLRLAEAVHLSPAACWERLNRLEQAGIILGYGAHINLSQVARFTTVLVEVVLRSHRRSDFERFEAAVLDEPHVMGCDATGGGIDYLLRVVAADIGAYQALIERLLAAEIGIERYVTYVVTKAVKPAHPSLQGLPDALLRD